MTGKRAQIIERAPGAHGAATTRADHRRQAPLLAMLMPSGMRWWRDVITSIAAD
jgi:hypothetical protein